jgi:hypothetical protein
MTATVTAIRPKDHGAAARSRRYRQRKRDAAVTPDLPNSLEVVQLAARVGSGAATAADCLLAERWLTLLVGFLPAA